MDLVGSEVCNLFAYLKYLQHSVCVLTGQPWTGDVIANPE